MKNSISLKNGIWGLLLISNMFLFQNCNLFTKIDLKKNLSLQETKLGERNKNSDYDLSIDWCFDEEIEESEQDEPKDIEYEIYYEDGTIEDRTINYDKNTNEKILRTNKRIEKIKAFYKGKEYQFIPNKIINGNLSLFYCPNV